MTDSTSSNNTSSLESTGFLSHEKTLARLKVYKEDIAKASCSATELNTLKDATYRTFMSSKFHDDNKEVGEAFTWLDSLTLEEAKLFVIGSSVCAEETVKIENKIEKASPKVFTNKFMIAVILVAFFSLCFAAGWAYHLATL